MACRACDTDQAAEHDIARLAAELNLPPDQLCPQGLADQRLAQCLACEYLGAAETCLMCGCLVRLRVLHARLRCPHPGRAGWGSAYP